MKRKGGRVVSAGTTSVGLPVPAAASAASAPGGSPSADVPLPSIDAFSRFQDRRDDFDANWIMAQEDPSDTPSITFNPLIAEKLKLHQSRLDALRAGGSGGTGGHHKASPSTTSSSSAAAGASSATAQASRASAPTAKTTTIHVDASLEKAAQSNNEYRGERKTKRRPPALTITDSEGEDDTEYNPEEVAVVVPAAPKEKATPPPAKATPVPAKVEAEPAAPQDEGLQGDYLSFAAPTEGAKSLHASDLQATVMVGQSTSATGRRPQDGRAPGANGRGDWRNSPSHNDDQRHPTPAASSSPVTVPLWSVRRVERYGGYCASNQLVALHQEVMDFIDYLRPTQAEVSVRRYLEKEVSRLAKSLWPQSDVIVYGSLYTHLLLPLSDVDMTLVNVPVPQEEALTLLAKAISQADLCEAAYPQVILKTKVPLVKFAHKGSLVPVDISVDATDGKTNSDIVIRLMQLYPQAQPLTTLVKYFLQQRGMDEPYHGGLGSYATTLLVISFLQNHPIYTSDRSARATTGLGKLLVDFFRYHGLYWNYQQCGVSVEDGGRYFYRDQFSSPHPSSPTGRGPQGPTQAVIEDPANSANNAASSLRMLHVITSLFAHAYQSLTANLLNEPAHTAAELSPDAKDITLRPTLLSRIMHVDAETVYRRQCIDTTYAHLKEQDPEYFKEVEAYRADEDAPLLTGKRTARVISGELKGAGVGVGAALSATTAAERVTLASLRAAASKPDSDDDHRAGHKRSRNRRRDGSSSSDSSSSSSSSRSSSSRSNASSVRKDASHRSHQRRRLEDHSHRRR